jgi:hypothetical protein
VEVGLFTRNFDRHQIATAISLGVSATDPGGTVKWLMNVADKVNDEPQCLSLRVLVRAGLEYVYIVLQGFDDVVRLRHAGRQRGAVCGERLVDEVKRFEGIKFGERSEIVRPVGGVDEVLTLFGDSGGVYRPCEQFLSLRFGSGVKAFEGDRGNHHVSAGSPAQGK